MQLDDLKVFLAVVETGSMTAAADTLEVPKSTVSRRIAALEEDLGLQLLNRTTRKQSLTEAGERLLQRAQPLVAELQGLDDELVDWHSAPQGPLRVQLPLDFFSDEVGQIIAQFVKKYPKVQLCCTHSASTDLDVSRGFDLVFVLHALPLPDSDWVAKPLMSVPMGLFHSVNMPDKQNITCADLVNLPCIASGQETYWPFRGEEGPKLVPIQPVVAVNSPELALQVSLQGAGVVRMPVYLAHPWVVKGKLHRVMTRDALQAQTLSVCYQGRQIPRRVRLFIEHFQQSISNLSAQV